MRPRSWLKAVACKLAPGGLGGGLWNVPAKRGRPLTFIVMTCVSLMPEG